MALYRDVDGAIWIDDQKHTDMLRCIYDPDDAEAGFDAGPLDPWYDVAESFGPLVMVEPTGWKEV